MSIGSRSCYSSLVSVISLRASLNVVLTRNSCGTPELLSWDPNDVVMTMMMMAPKAGSSSLWRASALVPKGFRSKKSLISRLDGTLEPQEQETCYGGSKTRQQQHITSILWLGLDWLFKVSRIFVTWFESLESAKIDFRLIVWCLPTGNVYFVISSRDDSFYRWH